MEEESTSRLERVMEAGFATLADLLRETNARVEQTNAKLEQTNAKLEQTNLRLDELTRDTIRGFAAVQERIEQTNVRLGRLEDRFEHFIETAGGETRRLRRDLDALCGRVERIESRMS
ncbi:MAG: hypothetical protein HY744_01870 [Deltaproteobacteria bacterium]|nr:hypothetical protein [Deltaproteobacteria bacterium]